MVICRTKTHSAGVGAGATPRAQVPWKEENVMRITKVKGCWILRGERRSTWEPIEASQIEEVRRLGEKEESKKWGREGKIALRWFELGETRSGLYQEPSIVAEHEKAGTAERAVGFVRSLIRGPASYRFEGC